MSQFHLRVFLVVVALAVIMLVGVMLTNAADVSGMNAKLKRYVHPTGKCAGADELMATMYGNDDGHLGKPVACGGVLDRKRATVAHRTLPCGAKLRISNPRNGRHVVAVVNDRGPYTVAKLDLGPAAYRALGMDTSMYVCVTREGVVAER